MGRGLIKAGVLNLVNAEKKVTWDELKTQFTKNLLIVDDKFTRGRSHEYLLRRINEMMIFPNHPQMLLPQLLQGLVPVKQNNQKPQERKPPLKKPELSLNIKKDGGWHVGIKRDKPSTSSSLQRKGGIDLGADNLNIDVRGQAMPIGRQASSSLAINPNAANGVGNIPFDIQNFQGFTFQIIEFRRNP